MDLRLVAYFVAVVDHGGITNAAQALYISQPSLSQTVRTLERQLGVQLFDRTGRRLTLTKEGVSFLAVARQILDDVELARSRVSDVRERVAGRLDLAAFDTLAVDPLADLAGKLRRRYPGIALNVRDPGSPAGVVAEIRAGRAEVGLTQLPVSQDNLLAYSLAVQEIALALAPATAAALPDPVPLEAVAAIPLVMAPVDTSTRALIDEKLENVVVECAHRPALWELVRLGAGATLLPRVLAERELGGVVVRSTVPTLRREIGLLVRPGPLSPAAAAFFEVAGLNPMATNSPARRTHDRRAKGPAGRTPGRTPA